ncbi:MAG: hypothetical protein FJ405_14280 [Verrucomicrobia bacterium]|nr:hypothetical protein [Verrucomicrobiota bacterium]
MRPVVKSGTGQPNILFILTDDQGAWALNASGYASARTPNLNRLAAQGARFLNAYTPTPVCSPSRASLLTSRYGSELGILDWIRPEAGPELGVNPTIPAWPRILLNAGYRTGLIGKWHLGNTDTHHPRRFGYEHFSGFRTGGVETRDPMWESGDEIRRRNGFTVDITADEAIRWLEEGDRSRRFALSVHFREPHSAYLPVREEDWAMVKDLQLELPSPSVPGQDTERTLRLLREYLASVVALDRCVGRILESLDRLGLADQTLVIFTSDHGYNLGHHGLLYKGNAQWLLKAGHLPAAITNIPSIQRPNLFETSLKVPLIVRWPGAVKPGSIFTEVVSHLDWLPTFAEIAGERLSGKHTVRGRSLISLLQRGAGRWPDEFYAEYSMRIGARADLRMIRRGDWKWVSDLLNPGRQELYNLADDPDETRNLVNHPSPAARRAAGRLERELHRKLAALNAQKLPGSDRTQE